MDDAEFERLYGPWDGLDPAGAAALLTDFDHDWWIVGGYAIEAFTGVRRDHEDVDVVIWRRDLPDFLELVRGRYHVWSAGAGMLRPVNDDWPEPHEQSGQLWLREHSQAPWVLDCLFNDDADGLWVSRRDETWTAPLENVTWVAEDGLRYMNPEVVLYHKAMQARPKDELDRDRAWPLLAPDRQDWLRGAILDFYGADHAWSRWLEGQGTRTAPEASEDP
jgi:hypothetical protein